MKIILFLYTIITYLMSKSNNSHVIHNQGKHVHANDTIFWSEHVNLSWNDFQGEVDHTTGYFAVTSAGFTIKYVLYTENKTIIELRSYFYKPESWVIRDSVDVKVLKHELFHFHIAEFALRKLKSELSNLKMTQTEFHANFNNIVKKSVSNRGKIHDLYDEETNHSLDSTAQKRWEKNIMDSLALYSKYSNSAITIKFTLQ